MQKQIKEIQEAEQLSSLAAQIVTPTYDDIYLTDDEIQLWTEWALRKARRKKAAMLNEMAYAAKLRMERGYKSLGFDELKEFVLSEHKDFVIDESNEEIFDILCAYFSQDPSFELAGHSFMKGIMLIGPVGCGKTTLMKMFAINSFRPFCVTSCRVIADDYVLNGTKSLYQYSELKPAYPQQNFGHEKIGQCFDDLGTEDDKKNFGNSVNVMADVILKLYDNRNYNNFHITTNIGGDEVTEIYGDRVRSRMREMFNVFKFDKGSKDRRR